MKDKNKTKEQLIKELMEIRKKLRNMEASGSDHKKTEETLRVSDARLQTVIESIPFDLFALDTTGRYIIQNSICREHWGDVVGKRPEDLAVDKETLALWQRNNQRAFSGEIVSGEVEFTKPDGEKGYYYNIISPIMEGDQIRGILGINIDISERRLVEDALMKSEEKFRSLADQSPNMIFINRKGKVVYANKKCEEIMGYSLDELYSPDFDFLTLIAPKSLDLVKEKYRIHMMGNEVEPYEYTVITKTGKKLSVINSTRLIDYNNEKAILGVITDISERKRLEAEVLEAHRLESLGELSAGIAHNFNNILTVIDGNISLAKMYAQPGMEVFDILGQIEKASHWARSLAQQLLTFSKGGVPIKEVISLQQLIKDSAHFALGSSNTICTFDFKDDLWTVEADRSQIDQVINNIIMNAQQSMKRGGEIKVSALNVTLGPENALDLKPGNYVKVSIEDQGTGIPEEDLQKIFKTYFTTKPEAIGLGLASAFSIIKKHDGLILAESQSGVGTTFSFYLPASKEEAVTIKEEDGRYYVGSGKGKILVMEDEEIVREVIGRMLEQCGYRSKFAKNGEEAVAFYKKAKASRQPFDAVIIDLIIIGGMGGKEAVAQLREIDPDIKAIVSSGYSNDPIMANYKKFGFKAVLTKPYIMSDLCAVLNKVIEDSD